MTDEFYPVDELTAQSLRKMMAELREQRERLLKDKAADPYQVKRQQRIEAREVRRQKRNAASAKRKPWVILSL